MTSKPYKDYEKVAFGMPGRPDVLKLVDTVHGVVYINTCAAEDAQRRPRGRQGGQPEVLSSSIKPRASRL